MSIPKQHKAVHVKAAGQKFEVVTVDTPTPSDDEVLVKVSASGLCYSDHYVVDGSFPGVPYPLTPGHEVVGRIVASGKNIDGAQWKQGGLVGVGWNGGWCSTCPPCRAGNFHWCTKGQITGINKHGGHQEYVTVHHTALVRLPEDSGASDAELAPLLCAGITVHDAIKASGIESGQTLVVVGLGGLGHLAIQYGAKMGLNVIAVSGSKDKEKLAKSLGAHHYFAASDKPSETIQKLGGARTVVATAPDTKTISEAYSFLGPGGRLMIVGIPSDGKPLEIPVMPLVVQRQAVHGLTCGTASDNEATINFSSLTGIKSLVTEWPIEKAAEAYDDVMNGKPKFRNVIVFK